MIYYFCKFAVKEVMNRVKVILSLIIVLILSHEVVAQEETALNEIISIENNLKATSLSIIQTPVESIRRKAVKKFIDSFKIALEYPESFDYPFDSFKTVQKLYSPDKKMRLYTFNLILNNQDHHYFGFIQYKTKKGIVLMELKDTLQTLPKEHLFAELYENEWIGCLYYDIKEFKKKGTTYYTVLGYDGATRSSSKKWADVIWFNKDDEITFGYPLFKIHQDDYEPQYRYELEYANDANAVFKHETTNKKKRDLIVLSFLDAKTPSFKDVRSAYYPDGTYDFFIFEKKKWVFNKNLLYFDFKPK